METPLGILSGKIKIFRVYQFAPQGGALFSDSSALHEHLYFCSGFTAVLGAAWQRDSEYAGSERPNGALHDGGRHAQHQHLGQ